MRQTCHAQVFRQPTAKESRASWTREIGGHVRREVGATGMSFWPRLSPREAGDDRASLWLMSQR